MPGDAPAAEPSVRLHSVGFEQIVTNLDCLDVALSTRHDRILHWKSGQRVENAERTMHLLALET